MLDIATLTNEASASDTAVDVVINDMNDNPYPGTDGEPVTWQVVGEFSKQYRAGDKAVGRKVGKALQRGAELGDPVFDSAGVERLSYGVTGWKNDERPFSRELVVEILTVAPWIARQIERVIRAHSSFFAKSSRS